MKAIYKFYWDCGSKGDISGIFVAEESVVEAAIGKEVYLGEVLGKHSEVYGTLDREALELKSDDPVFVEQFIKIIGDGCISGYNPLDYIEQGEEDE